MRGKKRIEIFDAQRFAGLKYIFTSLEISDNFFTKYYIYIYLYRYLHA
jgi:hypothetical protein